MDNESSLCALQCITLSYSTRTKVVTCKCMINWKGVFLQ